MTIKQIAIYGGGGFGRELAWLVQSCNERQETYQVVCFIDDDEAASGTTLNNIPVMTLDMARQQFPRASVVGGVGNPTAREKMMERAASKGFDFETIIHPRVERSEWIEFGTGTIICAGNILTTNIIIGQHVHINLGCTIGHDALIGDFCTLAPGVHVSGCVHLGRRVYVGTGAVIINGTQENPLTIGDDAVIGAGACVTKSVQPSITVVGVPAKPLQRS
jgi:sugar O-acyltransferase (sialic acid O-acetyltransferase NeuD family)